MLTCLAKPHWFRHSVATAEVYEIPEKELNPSLIARSSLSMGRMGFISGLHTRSLGILVEYIDGISVVLSPSLHGGLGFAIFITFRPDKTSLP